MYTHTATFCFNYHELSIHTVRVHSTKQLLFPSSFFLSIDTLGPVGMLVGFHDHLICVSYDIFRRCNGFNQE